MFIMAYKNLETNKIYLNMAQAPICEALKASAITCIWPYICLRCPIMIIAKEHGVSDRLCLCDSFREVDDLGCADIAKMYGDEVASAFGYEKIIFDDSQEKVK